MFWEFHEFTRTSLLLIRCNRKLSYGANLASNVLAAFWGKASEKSLRVLLAMKRPSETRILDIPLLIISFISLSISPPSTKIFILAFLSFVRLIARCLMMTCCFYLVISTVLSDDINSQWRKNIWRRNSIQVISEGKEFCCSMNLIRDKNYIFTRPASVCDGIRSSLEFIFRWSGNRSCSPLQINEWWDKNCVIIQKILTASSFY